MAGPPAALAAGDGQSPSEDQLLLCIRGATSGELVASLRLGPLACVHDVKLKLRSVCDVPLYRHALLDEIGRMLSDDEALTAGSASAGEQELWLVRLPFNAKASQMLLQHMESEDFQGLTCDLKSCAHPDSHLKDGTTPLLLAAWHGEAALAQCCLDAGASVNLARNDGATPLFMASQGGKLPVIQLLCSAKAEINQVLPDEATSPLFMAAQNGFLETVEFLTDAKADPDLRTFQGATSLNIAAHNGHLHIVQHLCLIGADKARAADDGSTPLFSAAQKGHVDIVRHLWLESDATSRLQTTLSGVSPLWISCQEGHFDAVRFFCEETDAEIGFATPDGSTPLLIASLEGHGRAFAYSLSIPGSFWAAGLQRLVPEGIPDLCCILAVSQFP